jgi:branched-chain amino acid transport system permease protein
MFSFELLLDAIVLGLLVGCFYAAVSIGLSVSFGLLDVPHVAHPAFLVLAAYGTYLLNQLGVDPIIAGLMLTPIFFVFGILAYRFTTRHSSGAAATRRARYRVLSSASPS